MSRRTVLLAPIGAVVYTVAWLVLGAVSPGYELFGHRIEPYSWVSQPVSGLGLGVTAPWMNTAFVACGALIAAGVLSTAGTWWTRGGAGRATVVLLALMGVGMIVCGVFTLESMMAHLAGFFLAVPLPAVGLVLAGASLRRGSPALAAVGIGGGTLSLVLFAVFMATFDATGAGGNTGISGLVQRVLILVTMTAVVVVSVGVAEGTAARRGSARVGAGVR